MSGVPIPPQSVSGHRAGQSTSKANLTTPALQLSCNQTVAPGYQHVGDLERTCTTTRASMWGALLASASTNTFQAASTCMRVSKAAD
eukprot:420332-Pelagomonas_calceolata.AAC.1